MSKPYDSPVPGHYVCEKCGLVMRLDSCTVRKCDYCQSDYVRKLRESDRCPFHLLGIAALPTVPPRAPSMSDVLALHDAANSLYRRFCDPEPDHVVGAES